MTTLSYCSPFVHISEVSDQNDSRKLLLVANYNSYYHQRPLQKCNQLPCASVMVATVPPQHRLARSIPGSAREGLLILGL